MAYEYRDLSLHYERLLTEAVQHSGLDVYEESEEPGGGGRCGKQAKESVVYILLSVANEWGLISCFCEYLEALA